MTASLAGVRLWLSGSYPGRFPAEVSDPEFDRFTRFVRRLAQTTFRDGGAILHGSHPSITPVLLDAAEEYQAASGRKAPLTLAVSEHFLNSPAASDPDLTRWERVARVVRVPMTHTGDGGVSSRAGSLDWLRDHMAAECDVVIALGGRWWDISGSAAGVPEELRKAMERGLPCFLLPCFGGATLELLNERTDILSRCLNGLTAEQNLELAIESDPDALLTAVMAQVARLPVRQRELAGRSFRILSLDGGGIRGAFTAAVLARWESLMQCRVADYFDLIAGTSTGGILAIGLGLGIPAKDIVEFYRLSGPKIFPADSALQLVRQSFVHWLDSKFDGDVLERELRTAYGTAPRGGTSLANSRCRLLIPSYNSHADVLHLFRTPHFPFADAAGESDPVRVALSTAAAPTYFRPVHSDGGVGEVKAVDGGVWANCPGPAALAEAVGQLAIPLDRIRMLSIGTTFHPGLYGAPALHDGMVGWLGKQFKLLLTGDNSDLNGKIAWAANIAPFLLKTQAQTADYLCRHLLGSDRFQRIDSPSTATTLDDVRCISELLGLGANAADLEAARVRRDFLNGIPADPWK